LHKVRNKSTKSNKFIQLGTTTATTKIPLDFIGFPDGFCQVIGEVRKTGTRLILSGVHAQPLFALQQYDLYDEIGEEHIFGNIDDALDHARELLGLPKVGRQQNFMPSVQREKQE